MDEVDVALMDNGDEAMPETAATERVHEALRDAILTNALPAGQAVSQPQLAARFGVSRTPLREALRLLEREGLVQSEANRRVRIAPMSVEDLESLYALRIAIEPITLRLSLPAIADETLEAVSRCHDVMEAASERRDYSAWQQAHADFHLLVLQAAPSRMWLLCRQLSEHAERYRHAATTEAPTGWTMGSAEHGRIRDTVVARDAGESALLLARHYARVALNAVALLDPAHDPAVIRQVLRDVSG